MKEKIKQISWKGWLVIVVVSIALSILFEYALINLGNVNFGTPWRIALEVASSISIDIFSEGVAGDTVYVGERLTALVSLLFLYIPGPALLILYGINSAESPSGEPAGNRYISGFKVGIVVTLASLLLLGFETTMSTWIHKNSREGARESAGIDQLRHELATLAVESYEYLVLPEQLGGGEGSFEGLNIEDLSAYKELEKPDNFHFGESETDTLLRIVGTYKPDSEKESGETTLIVNVYPSQYLSWEKNY